MAHFTNSELAQRMVDLIAYWSTFNTEYSEWIGGVVGGGPNTDGEYPLTNWAGDETLLACPAQLADDVTGYVAIVDASAVAAAASAAAALISENAADADAIIATAQAVLADADRVAAEAASAEAVDAKVTAIAQAAAAVISAAAAAADAVLTAADVVLTNADVVLTNADVVLTNADVVLSGLDVGYASEWANAAEDVLVSAAAGGDEVDDYSAFHWAQKAEDFAAAADLLATADEVISGFWDFTNASGLKVGGQAFLAADIVNWNTAYGWGDHASTYEPLDATLVRDDDAGYNNSDWDTAYGWGDHASGGYAVGSFLPLAGGNITGVVQLTGNNSFPGSTSTDAYIYQSDLYGIVMYGAGTSWDFILAGRDGGGIMMVPPSTHDVEFAGNVSIDGTGTNYFGPDSGDANHIFRGDAGPGFWWQENDEGTDEKMWRFDVFGGNLRLSTRADDLGGGVDIMKVTRGTGTAVTDIEFAQLTKFTGGLSGVIKSDEYASAGAPTFAPNIANLTTGYYSESSNVLAMSTAGVRRLQLYASVANFAVPIRTTAAVFGKTAGFTDIGGSYINVDGKDAIDGSDTYLRLNQSGDYTSGVYTPGALRCDSTFTANGDFYQNGHQYIAFGKRILPVATTARRSGNYGLYDSYKTAHIWGMGTAYVISDTGVDFGNLYGMAYKHTNNTTGGSLAQGHMMVWCQNGTPYCALGSYIWTLTGYLVGASNLAVPAWNTAGQTSGKVTISTSAASGGSNGDIHYKY